MGMGHILGPTFHVFLATLVRLLLAMPCYGIVSVGLLGPFSLFLPFQATFGIPCLPWAKEVARMELRFL